MFLLLFLLFLNLDVSLQQDTPPAPPDESTTEWPSCDSVNCSSGFVCVEESPDDTGPQCVPAGPWSCLNATCDEGYHCVNQPMPCDSSPCYPVPVCVMNGFTGDIASNLPTEPTQDQPASDEVPVSRTTEEQEVPSLPPPPPPVSNPPGTPPSNNGTFTTCTDANPCFIGFKCVIMPNGNAGCKKVVTCADLTCPRGQRCKAVPLTEDAYCQDQADCTVTGCSSNEICVNDNNNTPYCRKPLTCNDISCSVTNNCRPGDNHTDAVCVATCPAGETWNSCGGCDSSCDDQHKVCDSSCQPTLATCRCNSGLVRGPSATCVDPSTCSGTAPPGSPVTPSSGVDLYHRCEALNCPPGQNCIVNGSDMSCGSSDVQCKCTQEQKCVLQVAPNCSSYPCPFLPTCVNYPVVNPPSTAPPAGTEPPASQTEPPSDLPKPPAQEPPMIVPPPPPGFGPY